MFNDRLVFNDKCTYPTLHPKHVNSNVETDIGFRPNTLPKYQVLLTRRTWSVFMMLGFQLSENWKTWFLALL
jgi:hypothetical protein